MHLQESGEMYLESILILSKKLVGVRSLDVAEQMGFSKPSVSRAIGLLKEGNYVATSDDGFLVLTPLGHDLATKIYERHTILTQFLSSIGVSEDIAAADACRIEHYLSEQSFTAIKRKVECATE